MRIKCLIPAAGYGTRMSMQPHQSKELLRLDGIKPLIQWHIDACNKYGFDPVIITRPEKFDMREWCIANNINYTLVNHKGEWAQSLLEAKDHWGEKNILLLPDTKWVDINVLVNIKKSLQNNKMVLGKHWVTDGNKWGMIRTNYEGNTIITEKKASLQKGWAWGIIGFEKNKGIELLTALNDKKEYKTEAKHYIIKGFKDVTRGN